MSLHEIRNKENDIKRRIKKAREESQALLEDAKKQAAQIKEKARSEGEQMGKAKSEKILAETRDETDGTIEQAKRQAEEFIEEKRKSIGDEVSRALDLVLGFDSDGRQDGA